MSENRDDQEVPQEDDTLPVPPPSFRERLLAAQRARALEAKGSTFIPEPLPAPLETIRTPDKKADDL